MGNSSTLGRSNNVSALAAVLALMGFLLLVFAIEWFRVLSKSSMALILVNQPIWFHTVWMPTGAALFGLWSFVCSYFCWANRAVALPVFVALWVAFAGCMLWLNLLQGTKPLWFVGVSALLFCWLCLKLTSLLRRGFQISSSS